MNIRLFAPFLGEEELKEIADSFNASWIGLGPKVQEFEKKFSEFTRMKSAIAVNSATSALHLAVSAFKFPSGKKVLVPAITFASSAFAPVYNGLEPVFVDVNEDDVTMSVDDLLEKCDKDCVAVIPVHYAGQPVKMDLVSEIAKKYNLKIIEDCAHTIGGYYKGKLLGNWGDIGCFSFEEKKAMTTGDGGMICSDDIELIRSLKSSRWLGIDKDTWLRVDSYTNADLADVKHWYYEINDLGFKYNMNDLAASIGLVQLKKLNDMNLRRSKLIEYYLNRMKELNIIKPLLPFQPEKYNYWIFGIRCNKRDELIAYLKKNGVATSVHYIPLTLHGFFKKWYNKCIVSEKIWQTFITLPLHYRLTFKEIDYIIDKLKYFEINYL